MTHIYKIGGTHTCIQLCTFSSYKNNIWRIYVVLDMLYVYEHNFVEGERRFVVICLVVIGKML